MPRLHPDDGLADRLEEGRAAADPEPRREQQRANTERRAAQHEEPDTGRHDDDRSRPSTLTRKMH